jgi:DNA-directed RNA polymerase specialized sigma subunit
MNLQEILTLADQIILTQTGEHLDDLQRAILEGSLQRETYKEIAKDFNCSESNARQVGSQLWQILSSNLGEDISKSNFSSVIERLQNSNILNFAQKDYIQIGNIHYCGQARHPPDISNSNSTNEDISNSKSPKISHQDLSEMPDLDLFYNRKIDLENLNNLILENKCRLITITGISGIGKTSLAVKLVSEINHNFQAVIWLNLANFQNFTDFKEHLQGFFLELEKLNFPNNHKPLSLTKYLQKYRCLIVLDNVNHLFCKGELAGKYKNSCEEYPLFFQDGVKLSHQSCLILIGWEVPREITKFKPKNNYIYHLPLTGLDMDAVRLIFKDYGIENVNNLETLINYYQGNPFYLKSVANLIQDLGVNITDLLTKDVIILPEDLKDNLQQQINRLSETEKQVLLLLVRENQGINVVKLTENSQISAGDLLNILQSLAKRGLIEQKDNCYQLIFVLKQYMMEN